MPSCAVVVFSQRHWCIVSGLLAASLLPHLWLPDDWHSPLLQGILVNSWLHRQGIVNSLETRLGFSIVRVRERELFPRNAHNLAAQYGFAFCFKLPKRPDCLMDEIWARVSAPKKRRRRMRPLRCPRRGSAPRGHEAMVSAIWGGRGEFALNILLRNTLTLSWSLLLWLKRHEELRLIKCTNLVDIFSCAVSTALCLQCLTHMVAVLINF